MNNEIGGYGGGDGGYGGTKGEKWPPSSSSSPQPKDVFGCRNGIGGSSIPNFLTKTFNIVSDANTDSIISWSLLGNSFIIWDHIKFSEEILPRFFKHSNLSSFVYQLNNYCFRKIGVDHRWEYANPNFQAEKEHLLANIKRRGQIRDTIKRNPSYDHGSINYVERLKQEINESKLEIEKLKARQSDIESHVMAFESEMKISENKSEKLMMYWAHACSEIFKINKRNIYKTGKKEKSRDHDDYDCRSGEANKKRKMDGNEKNGLVHRDFGVLVGGNYDRSASSTAGDFSQVGLQENTSADFMYWNEIMEEYDGVCEINEDGGTEMANNQANIAMDLEGLIAKPAG